jgi:hypothetical protein
MIFKLEKTMETVKVISIYVAVVIGIWVAGTMFANGVSDYEVIQPEPGVKCAVVSRMFNTSVDCWKGP